MFIRVYVLHQRELFSHSGVCTVQNVWKMSNYICFTIMVGNMLQLKYAALKMLDFPHNEV